METEDQYQRRCPRLGGPVHFGYCRTCAPEEKPCGKVLDCWWEYFDVVEFLRNRLAASDFEQLTSTRPASKMTDLLQIVEQARQQNRMRKEES